MKDAARASVASGAARYAAIAILLHWLIAALIVLQVVLAGRMDGPHTPATFAIIQLHKSVGITVLLLSLVRLGWRLANPPPPLPPTMAAWERRLAHWTHVGLYGVMIGMPLTGWIMVSASRIALPTLLFGVVTWPMIPGLPDLAPPAKAVWHALGEGGHKLIIKFAYVLIALHVAGALKHQLFSRDEPVLARMAPGAVAGRRWEPRLLLIAAILVGVVVFGRTVRPAIPPLSAPARAVAAASIAPPAELPQKGPPRTPVAKDEAPPPAAPVRWIVSPASRLEFETAWSGQPVRGVFKRWRAEILFSPEALARSKVTVTVDMASADTGDAQRDASLPAPDWFDSAAHPQAVFTATRFKRTGEGRYLAQGRIVLKGVARPLDLPFQLRIDGARAEARGEAALDRTAFGVGQGEFAAVDQIPAAVKVRLEVKARAAP